MKSLSKLTWYSGMASGLFYTTASAQTILFKDLNPDNIAEVTQGMYGADSVSLDLNFDNVPDIKFKAKAGTSFDGFFVEKISANASLKFAGKDTLIVDSSSYYGTSYHLHNLYCLGDQAAVDHNKNWLDQAHINFNLFQHGNKAQTDPYKDGYWQNKKQKYIGFSKQESDGAHFGWVRLSVYTDASVGKNIIKVDAYAYNKVPNAAITCGKTK